MKKYDALRHGLKRMARTFCRCNSRASIYAATNQTSAHLLAIASRCALRAREKAGGKGRKGKKGKNIQRAGMIYTALTRFLVPLFEVAIMLQYGSLARIRRKVLRTLRFSYASTIQPRTMREKRKRERKKEKKEGRKKKRKEKTKRAIKKRERYTSCRATHVWRRFLKMQTRPSSHRRND